VKGDNEDELTLSAAATAAAAAIAVAAVTVGDFSHHEKGCRAHKRPEGVMHNAKATIVSQTRRCHCSLES